MKKIIGIFTFVVLTFSFYNMTANEWDACTQREDCIDETAPPNTVQACVNGFCNNISTTMQKGDVIRTSSGGVEAGGDLGIVLKGNYGESSATVTHACFDGGGGCNITLYPEYK
jgi:hypothetical protein